MAPLANRKPIIIGAITCAIVFILTAYLWYTTDSQSNLLRLLPTVGSGSSRDTSFATGNDFEIGIKAAAIIETRPLRALIPLISHFASVLGPEWPILFFTRASTVQTLAAFDQGSQPFRRMVQTGQIKIIELPSDASLHFYQGISAFMASPWFWDQFGIAKHALLFQADSMICANSGQRMEDYFEYDFVGAPHPYFPEAFNGGLSLRNVTLSREVISKHNIADDIGTGTDLGLVEDVWFCDRMKPLGAKFPSRENASRFAVDYFWEDRPLGYHGINKTAQVDRMDEIFEWCPEAYLAVPSNGVLQLSEDELKNMTKIEDEFTLGGKILSFGQDS